MTFTEAAEVILRQAGKPLHYKRITQLAIEQNLLTHVGKTPETTMSTRLATLTKKDKGDTPIVRVSLGIFGLRDFTPQQLAAAAAELETAEVHAPADEPPVVAAVVVAPVPEVVAVPPVSAVAVAEKTAEKAPNETEQAARAETAAKSLTEEDDDDEPVFGEKDEDAGRRRRRRRRRGRGDRPETGDAEASAEPAAAAAAGTTATTDAAVRSEEISRPAPVAPPQTTVHPGTVVAESERHAAPAPGLTAESHDGLDAAPPTDAVRTEELAGNQDSNDQNSRDELRREPRREDRRLDDPRDAGAFRGEAREIRDETGRDAADLIVSLLTRREDRQAVPIRILVDEAVRSGKLAGEPNVLTSALSAAARVDAVRRESRGERPRLRLSNGKVSLYDWALGPDLVRAESDALVALERLREQARRQIVRRLNELPQPAFTEILVLLLERLSISTLRTARRPGLPQGEIHLAGVARRATEEIRVAVLIKRGGEIGRERVIELRGSMHHYGPAQSAWIITTGTVLSGAREESQQPNTTPITLIDGTTLGRLLDEHGVGVRHASVNVPYLDLDLFDSIRN